MTKVLSSWKKLTNQNIIKIFDILVVYNPTNVMCVSKILINVKVDKFAFVTSCYTRNIVFKFSDIYNILIIIIIIFFYLTN